MYVNDMRPNCNAPTATSAKPLRSDTRAANGRNSNAAIARRIAASQAGGSPASRLPMRPNEKLQIKEAATSKNMGIATSRVFESTDYTDYTNFFGAAHFQTN
jgi:hypothetical protein